MITPTFMAVDGGTYNVDDFQVVGVGDNEANIQVMDAEGNWTGMYSWFNAFDELPAGWFDDTGTEPAGISLTPGDAVFFFTSVEGAKVQSAGQVPAEVTKDVPVGFSMVGNASPVAIDIDSFAVSGVGDNEVNIQVMDSDGNWTGMYSWFNAYEELPAGWFDDTGTESAGITLQPGDSVFFYTSIDGTQITIPSAL